jgi:archaellum component FlaC
MSTEEQKPYERTNSQSGEIDTEKIRRRAAEDMRRNILLEQLSTQVTSLITKTDGVRDDITSIKNDLRNGDGRMDRLETSVKGLRNDIRENLGQLQEETDERVLTVEEQIKQHIAEHLEAEKARKSVWAGVLPGIIASVVASLATATIVGGIVYNVVRATP